MTINKRILLKLGFILFIIGAFLYLYFNYNPATSIVSFPKCPSYTLLGVNCPGCGSQRAMHQLLHFNILEALKYNPLLVITFPFITYLLGVYLYNFIFEKKHRIDILYNPTFTKILLIVIILYFILRNLPFTFLNFLNPN